MPLHLNQEARASSEVSPTYSTEFRITIVEYIQHIQRMIRLR